jgi:hypothetical protein
VYRAVPTRVFADMTIDARARFAADMTIDARARFALPTLLAGLTEDS